MMDLKRNFISSRMIWLGVIRFNFNVKTACNKQLKITDRYNTHLWDCFRKYYIDNLIYFDKHFVLIKYITLLSVKYCINDIQCDKQRMQESSLWWWEYPMKGSWRILYLGVGIQNNGYNNNYRIFKLLV